MPRNRPLTRILFFIGLFSLLLGSGHFKAEAAPLQKVTFIPLWLPQAQFAGYYVAQESGIYKEHGLNYPEDGIYALKETWLQKPDLCQAFVKASLKGWQRAFAEPELALDITMRNLKREHIISNRIHQKWMLERMRDIIQPAAEKNRIGQLKEDDFQRLVTGLKRQSLIEKIPNFNDFYQPVAGE